MRMFMDLTKSGIVGFVLVSGLAGYALSMAPYAVWDIPRFVLTMLALYFFSAGSFAINQAQEWRIDRVMPRTEKRPIPSGQVSAYQASVLGVGFIVLGTTAGLLVNPTVAILGLATVVLYNVLYTLYWKKKWAFGAVPGAIPGAMPVVIGYAANSDTLMQPEVIYAFMIMFLWQMPHFWSLAIRFKDDYSKGGIPVLPTQIGTEATLYHMGLYMFAYVGLALASPWFTSAYFVYLLVVIPFALKILFEFFKYYQAGARERWLPFFLWTNFSVLIFLIAPVIDKWHRYYISLNAGL
jgi:protoheme IX farnesyltransferase